MCVTWCSLGWANLSNFIYLTSEGLENKSHDPNQLFSHKGVFVCSTHRSSSLCIGVRICVWKWRLQDHRLFTWGVRKAEFSIFFYILGENLLCRVLVLAGHGKVPVMVEAIQTHSNSTHCFQTVPHHKVQPTQTRRRGGKKKNTSPWGDESSVFFFKKATFLLMQCASRLVASIVSFRTHGRSVNNARPDISAAVHVDVVLMRECVNFNLFCWRDEENFAADELVSRGKGIQSRRPGWYWQYCCQQNDVQLCRHPASSGGQRRWCLVDYYWFRQGMIILLFSNVRLKTR